MKSTIFSKTCLQKKLLCYNESENLLLCLHFT